jgi:hypothetical protein
MPERSDKQGKPKPEFGASPDGREFGGGDDMKGGHDLGGLGQGEIERRNKEQMSPGEPPGTSKRRPDTEEKDDIRNPAGSAGDGSAKRK